MGWLVTVNDLVRPYINDKALAEFMRGTDAEEFSQENHYDCIEPKT